MGGSLYQDLPTQRPGHVAHESPDYDRNIHPIAFAEGSQLARWYGAAAGGRVISIHHQAVNRLGRDLVVEARAGDDEVIEAIRWQGRSFVYGVQWHPEFHHPSIPDLLDCSPILDAFLTAARS
jgi:putative glutamine amidotransferase